jgi:hypothetical protein
MLGTMMMVFVVVGLIRVMRTHTEETLSLGRTSPSKAFKSYRPRPMPNYRTTAYTR